MNSNTIVVSGPARMMHDILPPYAKAMPKRVQSVINYQAPTEVAADTPVQQPLDQPADPVPVQQPPVSTDPAPVEQPPVPAAPAPMPTEQPPASQTSPFAVAAQSPPIRRPGISWAAIVLAVVAAAGLGAAAIMAFRG